MAATPTPQSFTLHTLARPRLPRISVPGRVKSPAEEARDQADRTGVELIEALASALPVMREDVARNLDRLLAQLRADEYEAGFQTGHAAGRAVGQRDAKTRRVPS